MHCAKCKFKSKLKLEKEIDKIPNYSKKLCSACGIELLKSKYAFYCNKCMNYYLCDECRVCKNFHFMKKTINLKNILSTYSNDKFFCDYCNINGKTDDRGVWHCTACSYDVCIKCLE